MLAENDPTAEKRGSLWISRNLQVDQVISRGAPVAITAGATPVIDAAKGDFFTLTPAEAETITIINGVRGQQIQILVLTSGTSSYTLTFGTGIKSTGTLATGTSDAKYFLIRFVCDGTSWYEVGRTAAQ